MTIPAFVLFDQTHLISLLLTYGLITMLTLYVRSFSQEKIKYARVSLGVLLITHACLQLFYGYLRLVCLVQGSVWEASLTV